MVQNQGADARRATYLSDSASVGLGIGECLTLLTNCVEDEAYFSRADRVISHRIALQLGALDMRKCEPMLRGAKTIVFLETDVSAGIQILLNKDTGHKYGSFGLSRPRRYSNDDVLVESHVFDVVELSAIDPCLIQNIVHESEVEGVVDVEAIGLTVQEGAVPDL